MHIKRAEWGFAVLSLLFISSFDFFVSDNFFCFKNPWHAGCFFLIKHQGQGENLVSLQFIANRSSSPLIHIHRMWTRTSFVLFRYHEVSGTHLQSGINKALWTVGNALVKGLKEIKCDIFGFNESPLPSEFTVFISSPELTSYLTGRYAAIGSQLLM